MTAQTNRTIVRQFFDECWNHGNTAILADIMAPEHVHHLPGWELHGPDAIAQLILDLHTAFPDFQITMDDEIATADKVVVRWTVRGTHLGNLGELAPTGKRVEYIGIDIIRCSDNKIVELWGVPDARGLYAQLESDA